MSIPTKHNDSSFESGISNCVGCKSLNEFIPLTMPRERWMVGLINTIANESIHLIGFHGDVLARTFVFSSLPLPKVPSGVWSTPSTKSCHYGSI